VNLYTTEEEQIQAMRLWWKKYGFTLVISVAMAISATFGWRYWQHYKVKRGVGASMHYQALLYHVGKSNHKKAEQDAKILIENFSATPYATMANLMLAKQSADAQQYLVAEKRVEQVIQNSDNALFVDIAQLRLARLQIQMHKSTDAIATLNKMKSQAFLTAVEAVKGDAYVQLHKKDDAKKAYQSSLSKLPKHSFQHTLLMMKLNTLT